jgi:hypothetical protein
MVAVDTLTSGVKEQARGDRRAALALRVAPGEVLVADDPIAVLGEQHVDRALREQVRAPRRVKEALLPIRHPKHPCPPPSCHRGVAWRVRILTN